MSLPFYVPPEQLIKDRAEFARKGIARGRSIVALEYVNGVLLMGENPSRSLHKLSEIYDRVAFAGVGRFNEFETLRVAGIRYADLKGFSYGRADVQGRGLANAYSQTVGQIFTQEVKPYEVEVLVVEVGDDPAGTGIYRIQFDGTLQADSKYSVIGGNDEALREKLAESFEADVDLEGTVRKAARAIQDVQEGSVEPGEWEAAVLDRTRGRRKFRQLGADEIEAALADA